MKLYNKITREFLGFINLEPPTIFRIKPNLIEVKFQKYIYLFPQKVHVIGNRLGDSKYFEKKAVYYWFLFIYIEVHYAVKEN